MKIFFLLILSLVITLEIFKYFDILNNFKKYKKIIILIFIIFKNKKNNLDNTQKRIININKILLLNSLLLIIKIVIMFSPQILLSIFNLKFYLFLISLKGLLVSLVFSLTYIKLRFLNEK